MTKITVARVGDSFLACVVRAIHSTCHGVGQAVRRWRSPPWHPASTAPYNQKIAVRVEEDGVKTTLSFPCLRTNQDQWINTDLGAPLKITPVEWRVWR